MTYELAKELREAGFPQRPMPQFDAEGFIHRTPEEERDWVYEPDLSELIKACGEKFCALDRVMDNHWTADAWNDDNHSTFTIEGATPEEAVARLYIALNKK